MQHASRLKYNLLSLFHSFADIIGYSKIRVSAEQKKIEPLMTDKHCSKWYSVISTILLTSVLSVKLIIQAI